MVALTLGGAINQQGIIIKTKAGKFLIPNLKDSISLDLVINGFYEKGLVKLLSDKIPPSGVFLDIGANIGSITVPLAKARPDIQIVAVEASPWIYEYLRRNLELNELKNVNALNFAVYHESGKSLQMFAPKDLFGKGSLKAVYTRVGEVVQTITIDDVKAKLGLTAIHFIKADVEGFESSVFKGMSKTAREDKPKIVFEFSEWAETEAGFEAGEAQSVILSCGYQLQELDTEFNPVGEPSSTKYNVKSANLYAF